MVDADVYKYARDKFKEELDVLNYPDLIVLPLTKEGEEQREYLINYQFDISGKLIHSSIYRYGAYEYNFEYNKNIYLAIIVNND